MGFLIRPAIGPRTNSSKVGGYSRSFRSLHRAKRVAPGSGHSAACHNCKSYILNITHPSPSLSATTMVPRTSSRTSSICSLDTMASVSSQQPQHPFLTPGRASTITSWTSSIERSPQPQPASDEDVMSREAAIQAYLELKAALFSKAASSTRTRSG